MDPSPTANAWQFLFNVYLSLGVPAAVLTIGALVFFGVKYRDKGPKDTFVAPREGGGGERVAVGLVLLMLLALAIAAYSSISVIQFQTHPPDPKDAIDINVVGRQWYWTFQYPNGVTTVGVLRVPAGTTIVLNVTSGDVFHDLGIPDFKVKADAIPGYHQSLWFMAPETGNYTIRCYEFCGVGHAFMTATLVVMDPSSFQEWYASGGKTA